MKETIYKKLCVVPLAVWILLICSVYGLFFLLINKTFSATDTNYYSLLTDAFVHKRFNIYPINTYDLSYVPQKNEWFLYWGPSVVLFVLPFYHLFGVQTSDVLYGLLAGICNVGLFTLALQEVVKYFRLPVGRFGKLFIILNFAFISPNFYLSMQGTIWHINQIVAILFLLIFYIFYFKFLQNLNRWYYLIGAITFYNLAWTARFSLVLHGILFLYILFLTFKKKKITGLLTTLVILIGFIVSVLWIARYNYIRFGNPFEIGYHYQIASPRFREQFHEKKTFSLSYIPHNASYYFLHTINFSFEKPYLLIDPEGNSIFSVYPFTILLLIYFLKKEKKKNNRLFISIMVTTLAANLLLMLSNLGTGWTQFGSRYFFDIIPGLFLLGAFIVQKIPFSTQLVVLIYGCLVNFIGSVVFYTLIHPR